MDRRHSIACRAKASPCRLRGRVSEATAARVMHDIRGTRGHPAMTFTCKDTQGFLDARVRALAASRAVVGAIAAGDGRTTAAAMVAVVTNGRVRTPAKVKSTAGNKNRGARHIARPAVRGGGLRRWRHPSLPPRPRQRPPTE